MPYRTPALPPEHAIRPRWIRVLREWSQHWSGWYPDSGHWWEDCERGCCVVCSRCGERRPRWGEP